jgi:hypothetical protein
MISEDDLFGRPSSHLVRKGGKLRLEELDAHPGSQVEHGASRGGVDEADEPAPGEAVLDDDVGPRAAAWRPGAPQERFQADPVLVGRPELDAGAQEGGRHRPHERPQYF